jgi:hypothetical protein
MNHIEAIDKLGSVRIDKLFWIAAQMETDDLKETIEELYKEDWEKLFPEIYNSDSFEEYVDDDELMQALVDYQKIGFFAVLHIPKRENFSYSKEGRPQSWSSLSGVCRVVNVYAETIELLLEQIEKEDQILFDKDVVKDKLKSPTNEQR